MSQKNFTFQTVLRPVESNKQWQESSAEMSLSFNCLPSGLIKKTCVFFQQVHCISSWWFQPNLKNMIVKLDHFPKVRGENKKIFETTTQIYVYILSSAGFISTENPTILFLKPTRWPPKTCRPQGPERTNHHLHRAKNSHRKKEISVFRCLNLEN